MKVLRFAHHAAVPAYRERERSLRAQGVDVFLVSSKAWDEGGTDQILEQSGDDFVVGAWTLGRHPSIFIYDPAAVWRAFGRRPDLIDLHEEPNAFATFEILLVRWLRRCTAPYLLYSAQNIDKRYPLPFRWFERTALAKAGAVYVCNDDAGRIMRRKGLLGRLANIPLGVDLACFHPLQREEPGVRPKVGYVGRLEPHKGVAVLLEAAATHPEWDVLLSGEGSARRDLELLSQRLGISDRVKFVGHATGPELGARYRDLDVVVVPSLATSKWREQFCRVAVEAMASGVPVVASRSGALPDVVGDAGLLVAPGDSQALQDAIAAALVPARWTAMREAGAARAARFSWTEVARAHKSLYEDLLHGPVSSASFDPEVLVVAYGDPGQLAECLSTLGRGFSVTIVDNSSSQRTREIAGKAGARYIDASRNRGFAGGVNLGLYELARLGLDDRDVLLLNPDARLSDVGVRAMQQVLHSSRTVAATGATQRDPASHEPVRVWWPFPSPFRAWLEAVGLGRWNRRQDFAIGSALMLKADALRMIGRLDERFFLYAEETDWQRRARAAGWKIRVAEVEATHIGGGTGGDPSFRERHFFASAELYIRKHHGTVGWLSYRAANLVGTSIRCVILQGTEGAAARRRLGLFRLGPVRALREQQTHTPGESDAAAPEPPPMRVMHLVCSGGFAGVERYVQATAIGMARSGCAVTVIGGAAHMQEPLSAAGVHWLPGSTLGSAALSLLRHGGADVLVTHMTSSDLLGSLLGFLRRIPVVSVRHFAAGRGRSVGARALARVLGRNLAEQIAVSAFVQSAIDGSSVVVPSGVQVVEEVDDGAREPFVLVLQRLESEKATDVAIRAWAAAEAPSPWRLVIAGRGRLKDGLVELAEELGVARSVEFVGFQPDPDLWLKRASLLLAPAPAEPFGLSVVEAMAHGLPVLAAAGGAHVETVGVTLKSLLFEPGDWRAAGRALASIINDKLAREAYGHSLRLRQRELFDLDEQVEASVLLLERVVRSRSRRRDRL